MHDIKKKTNAISDVLDISWMDGLGLNHRVGCSPGRYVLKIHSNVESGPKTIQFNIHSKFKAEIFIQQNIHSIYSHKYSIQYSIQKN